jgi:hypothetical protein
MGPMADHLVLQGGRQKMALLPAIYTKKKLLKEEIGIWICIALKERYQRCSPYKILLWC